MVFRKLAVNKGVTKQQGALMGVIGFVSKGLGFLVPQSSPIFTPSSPKSWATGFPDTGQVSAYFDHSPNFRILEHPPNAIGY